MSMLALLAGVVGGACLAWAWLHFTDSGRGQLAHQRHRDRTREALALAKDWLDDDSSRALKHARRALRGRTGEAHAVMGACLYATEHYGQALWHHRRAQDLANRQRAVWQADNAIYAAKACWTLRLDVKAAEAQDLWDEAHEWINLARRIDREAVVVALNAAPWLGALDDREEAPWLQP